MAVAGLPSVLALAAPPPWLLASGAALALVAAALVVLWLRRRRLPRRVARKLARKAPRYPLVLAHGMMGFDEIQIGAARHDYFRGVPARLESDGAVVHRARVAKTAGIASRAEELASFIRDLPARRVNVVAHSMGGLDARYAIARLGLAGKIATLTTVGCPHLGTPVAELGAKVLRGLSRIGIDISAFEDLTTARMSEFNAAIPDMPGVVYGSVVGVVESRRELNPLLLPTYLWLVERAGASDGVVPASSQRWGEVLRVIAADHWAQIGWSRHFDAAEFYADLARELRGRGF